MFAEVYQVAFEVPETVLMAAAGTAGSLAFGWVGWMIKKGIDRLQGKHLPIGTFASKVVRDLQDRRWWCQSHGNDFIEFQSLRPNEPKTLIRFAKAKVNSLWVQDQDFFTQLNRKERQAISQAAAALKAKFDKEQEDMGRLARETVLRKFMGEK